MCLLVFACLLVYLFICLFIIWKWLYKLFMNMLLQIETFSPFRFFKLFWVQKKERLDNPKNTLCRNTDTEISCVLSGGLSGGVDG